MKKIIIGIISLLVLSVGFFFFYQKINRENGSIRPIYFVPSDAVYFIESNKPIEAWKKVKTNPMWQHMLSNKTFGELASGLSSLDEIMSQNQFVFDLFGNRKLMVSAHMYKHDDYDFLYLVDVENKLSADFVEEILKKSIDTDLYRLTSRKYKENLILELLDKEYRETIYISVFDNVLIASYKNSLVEKSLDEYQNPKIGRDINFIDVSSKTDDSEYLKIYFNYNEIEKFASIFLEEENELLPEIAKSVFYSGLSFDLEDNGLLEMNGYTGVNDTVNSFINSLNQSGKGQIGVDVILPEYTSFYMSIGFENFSDYINNFEKTYQIKDEAGFKEYKSNNERIENFLGISLEENFYSWIDDEVVFMQLQAGGLGSKNEFAFCIKMRDLNDAKSNLEVLKKQIKRNTPGKFKSVDYKGYEINYLSIKGFFKAIMGKFFSKLEKPYYSIIGNYVVFSNHPQTLRIIIDKYIDKKTLYNSLDYKNFIKEFSVKSNVFCYINTSKLFSNLIEMSDADTKQSLFKNKNYITCFDQIGFQMKNDGKFFETNLTTQFKDPKSIKINQNLNFKNLNDLDFQTHDSESEPADLFETLPIVLKDFDVKKYEEFYDNDILKVEVEIEDGIKEGVYKQYYQDGTLMLKGHFENNLKEGNWKFYNKDGDVVEKRRFSRGVVEE